MMHQIPEEVGNFLQREGVGDATPRRDRNGPLAHRERLPRTVKSELGLHHDEGRSNWRSFHHHASLCNAAYEFLMRERLRS